MQIEGHISLIFMINHPSVDLYSLKTRSSFSSFSSKVKSNEMTISKVEYSLKKVYFRCEGNGFSVKSDYFSIEEIGFGGLSPRSSNDHFMKIGELALR